MVVVGVVVAASVDVVIAIRGQLLHHGEVLR